MGQKAKLHFNLRNSWVLLLGIVLALAVFVIQWAPWQARVLSVSPQDQTEAAATLHITLQFKQPMQIDSVAAHFSVTPEKAGKIVWDGNTFEWIPENPLEEGVYTAHLSAGALAVDGRKIQREMNWTFRVRTG
ncbi:MAG: Ig-like domain-containing protein, partial [Anaerolineaceae bacterium]